MTPISDTATLDNLSPDLVGRVIAPADAEYDKARTNSTTWSAEC